MNVETAKALEQLKLGGDVDVWEACKLLSKQADLAVVPQLLDILTRSRDVKRRVAAAAILGFLRSLAALEPLSQILDNRHEPSELRDQAAESLGYLSDSKARDVLLRNLSDENLDVVFSCAFALRTVGQPDDIPHLLKLTHDSSLANSYGALVAQEAREAIEQIRDRGR